MFDSTWAMQVADCCETLVGLLFNIERPNAEYKFLYCLTFFLGLKY